MKKKQKNLISQLSKSQKISFAFFLQVIESTLSYNKQKMDKSQSQSFCEGKRRDYIKVSQKAKESLIELVVSKGRKIISAAKFLKISPETARMIIYRYRKKLKNKEEVNMGKEKGKKQKLKEENEEKDDIQNLGHKNMDQIKNIDPSSKEVIAFPCVQIICLPFSVCRFPHWQ